MASGGNPDRSVRQNAPFRVPTPAGCLLFAPGSGDGILSVGQQSASADLVSWGKGQAEAYVVVPVVRPVVVPISRAAVLSVVVPTATPIDAVRASSGQNPKSFNDHSPEGRAVSGIGKGDERFDMPNQFGFGPWSVNMLHFVFPQFARKPLSGAGQQADVRGVDPEAEKGNAQSSPVDLDIVLEPQGQLFFLEKSLD